MYMTKMLIDKVDTILEKVQKEEQQKKHFEELQKRRRESVEKNKKMAESLKLKRQEIKFVSYILRKIYFISQFCDFCFKKNKI